MSKPCHGAHTGRWYRGACESGLECIFLSCPSVYLLVPGTSNTMTLR